MRARGRASVAAGVFLATAWVAGAWELVARPEFIRPDPFGGVISADWTGEQPPILGKSGGEPFVLKVPRNGYASFHVAAIDPVGGEYAIGAFCDAPVEVELFRAWFHLRKASGRLLPDALIPHRRGETLALPDRQMAIAGQTAAAFYVDVWVPRDSVPGDHPAAIELNAGGRTVSLPFIVRVLELTVPDDDAISIDHNTYGSGWVGAYFPQRVRAAKAANASFANSPEFFRSIHEAHALLHEHRAIFHMLGYGHSGAVNGAMFAPVLEGSGRQKRIADWDLFDRHHGPLLDGTAFEGTRRGPRPIPFVYLPINPEWPASYVHWGRPAYEVEFVNVVSEMARHFREKGWTGTRFEMFFNHKKRYKAFEWDGDETRFPKDNVFFREYGRLLRQAVPEDSPVKFVFRHDASWMMRSQFDDLAGIVDFWVCGGGIFSFYPEAPALLKGRGDILWVYGGLQGIESPAVAIAENLVSTWMRGADGFLRWMVTGLGGDPFFDSNGGHETIFYPGDRFGVDGLIPSIRLKNQRNCAQDIALLELAAARSGADAIRGKVAGAAGGATPSDWWVHDAPIKNLEPWEWSNSMIGRDARLVQWDPKKLPGDWWLGVRAIALQEAAR